MFYHHPEMIKVLQDDRYYRLARERRGWRTNERSPRPVRKLR
jgi:hypothetical protein